MLEPYPHSGLGISPVNQAPHLLLRGLDEQEGGLVSFTLEIEPGGRDHTCYPACPPWHLQLAPPTVSPKVRVERPRDYPLYPLLPPPLSTVAKVLAMSFGPGQAAMV